MTYSVFLRLCGDVWDYGKVRGCVLLQCVVM